jgi:hypothetical protein
MMSKDLKVEILNLRNCLPINYQLIKSREMDKNEILRAEAFSYYNSSMSVCKAFHRPISKLLDKNGRI